MPLVLIAGVVVYLAAHGTGRKHPLEQPHASGPPSTASSRLRWIVEDIPATLAASRRVLLGSRPSGDATCITQELDGDRVMLQGDPKGGPGLRFTAFCAECPDAPLAVYDWSQQQLKPWLETQRSDSIAVLAQTEALAALARELADDIHSGAALASVPLSDPDEQEAVAWPVLCLGRLSAALEARDAEATRVWANELAAATFGLADLHRWLDTLLRSHLASLDFQGLYRDAFEYAENNGPTARGQQSGDLRFPGPVIAWGQNYLEVERQAEQTFGAPPVMTSLATYHDLSEAPAARWVFPEQRGAFLWLRSRLSPANRKTWDLAATSPWTHSYLAAVLYRAVLSETLDAVAIVLQRLDRVQPAADVEEMMDALFYRAGFHTSGFYWADRYDARLLDAAGRILGPKDSVIRAAHAVAGNLLDGWKNYGGGVLTLQEALDTRKLDCVRGTDLIGALYRNAGQGRYYLVRLNFAVAGHSVAAVPVDANHPDHLLIVDSLEPNLPERYWPTPYLDEFTWPEGYPGPRGPLFSAELYTRGLNGYIFAEGYVVRGSNAGKHVRAPLIHLTGELYNAVLGDIQPMASDAPQARSTAMLRRLASRPNTPASPAEPFYRPGPAPEASTASMPSSVSSESTP